MTLIEIKNFDKNMDLWQKPQDKTKIAVVAPLPSDEEKFLSKFYAQIYQHSPLGWVPVSTRYQYSTRGIAQDKVHRMGYSVPLRDQ